MKANSINNILFNSQMKKILKFFKQQKLNSKITS